MEQQQSQSMVFYETKQGDVHEYSSDVAREILLAAASGKRRVSITIGVSEVVCINFEKMKETRHTRGTPATKVIIKLPWKPDALKDYTMDNRKTLQTKIIEALVDGLVEKNIVENIIQKKFNAIQEVADKKCLDKKNKYKEEKEKFQQQVDRSKLKEDYNTQRQNLLRQMEEILKQQQENIERGKDEEQEYSTAPINYNHMNYNYSYNYNYRYNYNHNDEYKYYFNYRQLNWYFKIDQMLRNYNSLHSPYWSQQNYYNSERVQKYYDELKGDQLTLNEVIASPTKSLKQRFTKAVLDNASHPELIGEMLDIICGKDKEKAEYLEYVFHGTPRTNIASILKYGLDPHKTKLRQFYVALMPMTSFPYCRKDGSSGNDYVLVVLLELKLKRITKEHLSGPEPHHTVSKKNPELLLPVGEVHCSYVPLHNL